MTVLGCSCRGKLSVAAASLLRRPQRPWIASSDHDGFLYGKPNRLFEERLRVFSSKLPPRKEGAKSETRSRPRRSFRRQSRSAAPSSDKTKDKTTTNPTQSKNSAANPILQPSGYRYDIRRNRLEETSSPAESNEVESSLRFHLPALDASALLDPHVYCKTSAKGSHTHGVSRSISGTDAARRLLRGKKDFLMQARELVQHTKQTHHMPVVLLEGHGVPRKLFQHCIDMGDALLKECNTEGVSDIVECTFYNYNNQEKREEGVGGLLPEILRLRR